MNFSKWQKKTIRKSNNNKALDITVKSVQCQIHYPSSLAKSPTCSPCPMSPGLTSASHVPGYHSDSMATTSMASR